MKLYALKHIETGLLMGVSVDGTGDAEFCGSYRAELNLPSKYDNDYIPWTTTNYGTATRAAETDVPWYNSSMDSPMNKYVGKLEVIEFTA